MQETLIEFINDFGYIGIMLLILIENVFPPIPSEVVLVFGGFMTTQTEMSISLVILFATLGSTFGAAVLYTIGRILNRERIKMLFSGRLGKLMHLNPDDVTKAESWFKRYEYRAVLVCRCIPVMRSLISIPAGMARMKVVPFFALTVLGTAVWNTALVLVGELTGNAWEQSLKYIGWLSTAVICVLVIAILIVGYVFYIKRWKKSKDNKNEK